MGHESPKLITYPLESNTTRKYQQFSDVQSQKIRETAPVFHFQHAPVDNRGCIMLHSFVEEQRSTCSTPYWMIAWCYTALYILGIITIQKLVISL